MADWRDAGNPFKMAALTEQGVQAMILVGRYLSPFVRRVAVTMTLYGIPFERRALSAVKDGDAVRGFNPLGRVPALVLDDGETLIDSGAILDYLDASVGPERALTPATDAARRRVLRLVALATGAAEKSVAAVYERQRRPADKVYPEWAEKCEAQARAGMTALENVAGDGWLIDGRLTQADVSAVCVYDFANVMLPGLLEARAYPKLAALVARASALDAFATTHPSRE